MSYFIDAISRENFQMEKLPSFENESGSTTAR